MSHSWSCSLKSSKPLEAKNRSSRPCWWNKPLWQRSAQVVPRSGLFLNIYRVKSRHIFRRRAAAPAAEAHCESSAKMSPRFWSMCRRASRSSAMCIRSSAADAASGSSKPLLRRDLSRVPMPELVCSHMFWSRSSRTTRHSTGSRRTMPAKASISTGQRSQAGRRFQRSARAAG